jgi:sarcosine oxidase subunit beta
VTSETADVVVIGGGAMGASTAYHLASMGAGRIVLLEREAALGLGSTGRCAGGFRHQFSSAINVRLSLESVRMIRRFSEEHGLPRDVHVDGYLFLTYDDATWADYRRDAAMQRALGARAEELDAAGAQAIIPGLNVDGVVGATFGPDDGIADPSGLTNGYGTLARRHGADIRLNTSASAVRTTSDGGRVTGVELADGSTIEAPGVVIAAGVWSPALGATCGVDIPVVPEKRTNVVTPDFPGRPERRTLTIDTRTMTFFHREGSGVLMGTKPADTAPTFDTTVDDRHVADELLPLAIDLLPGLAEAGLASAWAGLYEMSPDHDAILGPIPGLDGAYLAAGFSGHGFQHSPIVGRVLAELITGRPPTVDIAELSLDRFALGRLVAESHVV